MAEIKAKKVIFKNRDGEYLLPMTVGSLKIGQIGIAPLGIDETLNMERYLNGQIIIQDQFKGFTKYLKRRIELYPSIACLEDEWQTIVTMSAFSQCGKFVIDDNAGTIRLPKVVNIQGLTDLSKLAEIVEAGLPSIDHTHSLTLPRVRGDGANADHGVAWGGDDIKRDSKTAKTTSNSQVSDIYGKSNTVQQEQIQYPYFIQVATGAETEDNIINEIELNNPFSLLDYKYSEYELNNLSWLRSNGQYNSKAVYPAVYDLLLKIYNGTETKAGVSVKLTTETFTDYDFVLNTAEETLRLPIKVKLASGKAVVGNGMGLGFTANYVEHPYLALNKSSNQYMSYSSFTEPALAGTANGTAVNNSTAIHNIGITTDSNYSGIETSDSGLYLYFYVGETVQNANLINAGRIEEIKANKSDLDGQWYFNKIILISADTTITASEKKTFDLSNYLPNDGNLYEVIVSASGRTGSTSGNHINLWVTNDATGMDSLVFRCITRTASTAYGGGTATLVIGKDRKIVAYASSGSTGTNTIDSLGIRAYRKVR